MKSIMIGLKKCISKKPNHMTWLSCVYFPLLTYPNFFNISKKLSLFAVGCAVNHTSSVF